jgi:hypothetical protein
MFGKIIAALALSLWTPFIVECAPAKSPKKETVSPKADKKASKSEAPKVVAKSQNKWQDFYSASGSCGCKMPSVPEHVSEKFKMPDSPHELKYDAYIADHNKNSVYMLLVAQYPEHVDQSYAQASLEGFLNGILSYNPANQLIFADLTLVNGHEALDFFIRAGAVYFRGRAMLIKNSLYLMAMECEAPSYDEAQYNHFISSFLLK